MIIITALAVKAQPKNLSDAEREQRAEAVIEEYVGNLNPKARLALDQNQYKEAIAAASIVLAIAPWNLCTVDSRRV